MFTLRIDVGNNVVRYMQLLLQARQQELNFLEAWTATIVLSNCFEFTASI